MAPVPFPVCTSVTTLANARQIPLRRLGAPSDVAAAVAFLASEEAAYITGQSLRVNGGGSMS